MFSGLRVAAAFAVIGAVFAEWVGSTGGASATWCSSYSNQTATADVFAAVVVLAVIGVGAVLPRGRPRAGRAAVVLRGALGAGVIWASLRSASVGPQGPVRRADGPMDAERSEAPISSH